MPGLLSLAGAHHRLHNEGDGAGTWRAAPRAQFALNPSS